MPQRTPNLPVCRDCDGFPAVAITTGTRDSDGSRTTITATCRACNGTAPAAVVAVVARAER